MMFWDSLVAHTVKHLPAMCETQVQSLGREDPMEKEMATHSSTLAWSGLPFPSPWDLPDPGIEPWSPALQAYALLSEPLGKPMSKKLAFLKANFGRLVKSGLKYRLWKHLSIFPLDGAVYFLFFHSKQGQLSRQVNTKVKL